MLMTDKSRLIDGGFVPVLNATKTKIVIETARETDGRRMADSPVLPGAMAYG